MTSALISITDVNYADPLLWNVDVRCVPVVSTGQCNTLS
jgi:hypothetical protein